MGHRTLNIDGNASHGVVDHGHYLVEKTRVLWETCGSFDTTFMSYFHISFMAWKLVYVFKLQINPTISVGSLFCRYVIDAFFERSLVLAPRKLQDRNTGFPIGTSACPEVSVFVPVFPDSPSLADIEVLGLLNGVVWKDASAEDVRAILPDGHTEHLANAKKGVPSDVLLMKQVLQSTVYWHL